MSELYLCVHVAEFPAQALLRLRSEVAAGPVVVLDGVAPHESVCAMNAHALRRGAAKGMSRLDVEGLTGITTLTRSRECESAARVVAWERAAKFSPRIEEVQTGTACVFVLDIAGTERLFGPPETLATRLRDDLAAAGFRASIAVSGNVHAARIKSAWSRGISVIAEGAEAVALAKLPLEALGLEEDPRETFAVWGIRTLGELAALPEAELIARLGQRAQAWRQAAWGMLPHTFQPAEPEFALREFLAFEDPVEEMDSLLFAGGRMIDALVQRAGDRALALARLTVRMKLDGGNEAGHELTLRPAIPSADRRFLLKLLQLEVAAHPPQAAVVNFELTAEAAPSSLVQLGLFAPQTPEPSRLDVTLARLKSIVGEERVGSPMLVDGHRPGAFEMKGFQVNGKTEPRERQEPGMGPRMGLRRLRPAAPVRMWMKGGEPSAFATKEKSFEVRAAYGPWRTNGSWWATDGWDLEEWDVLCLQPDGHAFACLMVRDCMRDEWRLEAMYD